MNPARGNPCPRAVSSLCLRWEWSISARVRFELLRWRLTNRLERPAAVTQLTFGPYPCESRELPPQCTPAGASSGAPRAWPLSSQGSRPSRFDAANAAVRDGLRGTFTPFTVRLGHDRCRSLAGRSRVARGRLPFFLGNGAHSEKFSPRPRKKESRPGGSTITLWGIMNILKRHSGLEKTIHSRAAPHFSLGKMNILEWSIFVVSAPPIFLERHSIFFHFLSFCFIFFHFLSFCFIFFHFPSFSFIFFHFLSFSFIFFVCGCSKSVAALQDSLGEKCTF